MSVRKKTIPNCLEESKNKTYYGSMISFQLH